MDLGQEKGVGQHGGVSGVIGMQGDEQWETVDRERGQEAGEWGSVPLRRGE